MSVVEDADLHKALAAARSHVSWVSQRSAVLRRNWDDLVGIANLAVAVAWDRYQPDKDSAFVTYAMLQVKTAVSQGVRKIYRQGMMWCPRNWGFRPPLSEFKEGLEDVLGYEDGERFDELIECCTEEERELLRLYYQDLYTTPEMTVKTGLGRGALQHRMGIARQKIRAERIGEMAR